MADRYLYFPSVGYSIFLGIAFKKFFDINKKYAIVTFAFLVIFYSAITFNLIGIWKNDLTLWSYAIKKSPESFFVIKNLAVSLYDRGRYDEAQKHLLKLINMKVGDSQVYSLNGSIEFNKGNYEGAVNYYKTANMIYPSSEDIRKSLAVSYYNLGIIYLNKKDLKKSMIYFKNAYDLDPNDKDVKKYIEVLKSEISEKGK